jgi:LacI family transcriptional regulator
MHVTLHDVAKQAGVSTKTVSRVVNNQGEISEATRQRVQAAIEQLDYHPNILARSLVNQRSNTLAVVAWGIDYYGPSRILVGIEKKSDELGYSLFLNLLARPDDSDIDRILDMLIERRVEGILWAVPEVGNNRSWIAAARLDSLPPVVFLSMESRPGLMTVSIDNRHGAVQATQHLIDRRPRHIGLITGPLIWWEARERYAGWQEALQQAGLTPSPRLVVEADWSAETGAAAMQTLLDREPNIDAVFACSDQIALGALGVAHRLGRRIPQDLAIVGFDNIPESAHFWPPLTTIYQHLGDIGSLAVEHLHRIIEAKRNSETDGEPVAISQVPELVIRESSRQDNRE